MMKVPWVAMGPIALTLCVLLAGCSSSKEVMADRTGEWQDGTYVLAVVTHDGTRIDFSSTFPGYALLADSTIHWKPTEGDSRDYPLASIASYEVERFSWWKTALFLIGYPVTLIGIALLIPWRFS
jgi:hypothetical protein